MSTCRSNIDVAVRNLGQGQLFDGVVAIVVSVVNVTVTSFAFFMLIIAADAEIRMAGIASSEQYRDLKVEAAHLILENGKVQASSATCPEL